MGTRAPGRVVNSYICKQCFSSYVEGYAAVFNVETQIKLNYQFVSVSNVNIMFWWKLFREVQKIFNFLLVPVNYYNIIHRFFQIWYENIKRVYYNHQIRTTLGMNFSWKFILFSEFFQFINNIFYMHKTVIFPRKPNSWYTVLRMESNWGELIFLAIISHFVYGGKYIS